MVEPIPLFGRRTPPTVAEPAPVTANQATEGTERTPEEIVEDYKYFLANKPRTHEANAAGDEMTKFLFDVVRLNRKDENIVLRRGAMKRWSLEYLTDYILGSGKKQWTAQPHMYGAAYLEWFDRILLVGAVKLEMERRASTE